MKKFLSVALSVILAIGILCTTGCNPTDDGGDTTKDVFCITCNNVVVNEMTTTKGDNYTLVARYPENYEGAKDNTTWKSSDTSVVKVTAATKTKPEANLKCVAVGTATVTVTAANGDTATLTVKVTDKTVTASVSEINMYLTDSVKTFDLKTVVTEDPKGINLTYKVGDSSVATVSSEGVVTAVKPGSTSVEVITDAGNKVEISVNVFAKSVGFVEDEAYVVLNSDVSLAYSAKTTGVTFTSSNTSIATVDATGKVHGVAKGTATITIKLGQDEDTIEVVVFDNSIKQLKVDSTLDESYINYFGRNYYNPSKQSIVFSYGASGYEVAFYGTELKATMYGICNDDYKPYMQVLLDGEKVPTNDNNSANIPGIRKFQLTSAANQEVTLVSGLTLGYHTVKVLKRSAYARGYTVMDQAGLIDVTTDGYLFPAPAKAELKIDVYGDSITCGYGNLDGTNMNSVNTNAMLTYAYQAAERLGAQVNIQAHSGWGAVFGNDGNSFAWYNQYEYIRYGNSDKWDFNKYQPDIIVINLGTNDASAINKTYKSADFIDKYTQFIQGLQAKCPNAKIVLTYGMMGTNTLVNGDIQTVVGKFSSGVYYLNQSNFGTAGGNGHPTLSANLKSGEELAKFIQEKVL